VRLLCYNENRLKKAETFNSPSQIIKGDVFNKMTYADFTTEELRNEIWKPCVQDNRYEVSNLGRVKRVVAMKHHSVKDRPLIPILGTTGYLFISLKPVGKKRRHYAIHQLVCRAFHGEPLPKQTDVNHKDNCRTNNRADNLEWMSRKDNLHWGKQQGRDNCGDRNGQAKLLESDVLQIIHLLKT